MKNSNRGSDFEKYFYGPNYSGEVVSDDYLPTLKLSQRTFGWQYPKQYSTAFKEFSDSYSKSSINVSMSGFAVSIDETRFLLIPTLDKLDMNVLCLTSNEQGMPDDHSYVQVKGKKTAIIEKNEVFGHNALLVDDFTAITPPDYVTSPDISFKDFSGLLFGNWSEIPKYITDAIGLSLVSSPPEPKRLGGLTTDLFLDREQRRDITKAKRLVTDVQNSLDNELFEPWKVELPVGKISYSLFKWKQSSLDADLQYENLAPLLNREVVTQGVDELSLNLASSFAAPTAIDDLAASKSDVPLILPSSADRIRKGSRDPRIANYLIAVHSSWVVGPTRVISNWLPRISEEIEKIRQEYSDATAFARLANPDIHGTPWSVIHTSYSLLRSTGSRALDDAALDRGLALVSESLRTALQKWTDVKQVSPRAENLLRSFGREERRIFFYLRDHPKATPEEVREEMFSESQPARFEKWFAEMHQRGLIYESALGKFSAAE